MKETMHADFTLQGEVLVTMEQEEQIVLSEIALLIEQHYSGKSFKSSIILLTTKLQISQYKIDSHEEARMEMNVWWVAKKLAYRIDGAPVFSDYIHCSMTEKPSDAFFFNNELLKQFQKATDGTKKETPGYFYIMKMLKFIEEHYRVCDLYMEYIKDGCDERSGEQCDWCSTTEWIEPVMSRIPEPMPDRQNQGHYKDVFDTPSSTDDSGKPHPIDEFSPHANLKKWFAEDKISFKQYAVEEEHVISYVQHMVISCCSSTLGINLLLLF